MAGAGTLMGAVQGENSQAPPSARPCTLTRTLTAASLKITSSWAPPKYPSYQTRPCTGSMITAVCLPVRLTRLVQVEDPDVNSISSRPNV